MREKIQQMEWQIIALHFIYAVLGIVLMFLAYRVFDWFTPEVDFPAELKTGNVAAAVFIAAISSPSLLSFYSI